MLHIAKSTVAQLARYNKICIVRAPKDVLYIGTDMPVYSWNPHTNSYCPGVSSLGLKDTTLTFALNRKTLLILMDSGPKYRIAFSTKESARGTNCCAAEMSYGFIYGSHRVHLESVVKRTKLQTKTPKTMFTMY